MISITIFHAIVMTVSFYGTSEIIGVNIISSVV